MDNSLKNKLINKAVLEQFDTAGARLIISIGLIENIGLKTCIDSDIPKLILADLIIYLQCLYDDVDPKTGNYFAVHTKR